MKKIIFLILILTFAVSLFSSVPKLKGRVNDYAGLLTTQQVMDLETLLFNYEQKTSAQIALLIIKSLNGSDIERYSMKVVEKWKLGQKDRDNGVLLLVALKEKKLRIEVGYGLEGIITDLKAGYIIRKIIVPYFKQGDYYQGIYKGLSAIGGLITNEYQISPEELAKYKKSQARSSGGLSGYMTLLFFIFFFVSVFSRRGSILGAILGMTISGYGSSSGSSSGGFFGGGGGGFSGGGGSFGGGGASGGW